MKYFGIVEYDTDNSSIYYYIPPDYLISYDLFTKGRSYGLTLGDNWSYTLINGKP